MQILRTAISCQAVVALVDYGSSVCCRWILWWTSVSRQVARVLSTPQLSCSLASLFCGDWWGCFQSNFVSCGMQAEWDGSWGGSVGVSISNSKYLNECVRGQDSNFLMLEGTCHPTHSWAVLEDSSTAPEWNCPRRPWCAWEGLGWCLGSWGCKEREDWLADSPLDG